MDVHRLRVLRAVVADGSIQGAAASLGYTPSAISQHVSVLQKETGLQACPALRAGIEPTAAGRAVAAEAARIFERLADLESLVANLRAGRVGALSVSYFASAGASGFRRWWRPSPASFLGCGWMPPVDSDLDVWRPRESAPTSSIRRSIQPQPRKLAGDGRHHRRNPDGTGGGENSLTDRAPTRPAAQVRHEGLEVGQSFEDRARLGRHRATRGGRLDPPPGALDKPEPSLLLQHADVLADGRRGVAEARRGALDRTVRHDRAQHTEPVHVHAANTTVQLKSATVIIGCAYVSAAASSQTCRASTWPLPPH